MERGCDRGEKKGFFLERREQELVLEEKNSGGS